MDSLASLLAEIRERQALRKGEVQKLQATRHQEDALATHAAFAEEKKWLGRYFRLFKRNTGRREELIAIREWVKSHGNNGRIFFAVCKRNNLS